MSFVVMPVTTTRITKSKIGVKPSGLGAIEFGLHGYELPILDANYPRKLYQPEKGDIILFPSQLRHFVGKNDSKKLRMTISFNINRIAESTRRVFA